jgi:transcription elongation factor Elf1
MSERRTAVTDDEIRAHVARARAGFCCLNCDETTTSDAVYRAYDAGEQLVCPSCHAPDCVPVSQ